MTWKYLLRSPLLYCQDCNFSNHPKVCSFLELSIEQLLWYPFRYIIFEKLRASLVIWPKIQCAQSIWPSSRRCNFLSWTVESDLVTSELYEENLHRSDPTLLDNEYVLWGATKSNWCSPLKISPSALFNSKDTFQLGFLSIKFLLRSIIQCQNINFMPPERI